MSFGLRIGLCDVIRWVSFPVLQFERVPDVHVTTTLLGGGSERIQCVFSFWVVDGQDLEAPNNMPVVGGPAQGNTITTCSIRS